MTHVDEPEMGYYRYGRTLQPVAIWNDSVTGELRALCDGEEKDFNWLLDNWLYIARNPIGEAAYKTRMATGMWPDQNAAVIGHNKAPADDSPEGVTASIAALELEAERLITAGAAQSEDIATQAAGVADKFGEIEKRITKLHKTEKEPHLEAGRLVDRRWFGLRKRCDDLKVNLKLKVITPFLRDKAEEDAKAKAAALAAGEALPQGSQRSTTTVGLGRKTALRTYYSAEIVDKGKLIAHLADNADLVACIQKIANAEAARTHRAPPGCKIISEQRAA